MGLGLARAKRICSRLSIYDRLIMRAISGPSWPPHEQHVHVCSFSDFIITVRWRAQETDVSANLVNAERECGIVSQGARITRIHQAACSSQPRIVVPNGGDVT